MSTYRYPSDDINKFLWMVRIGGGVFPDIKEKDYLANGQYRIDGEVTKACALTSLRVCIRLDCMCSATVLGMPVVALTSWPHNYEHMVSSRDFITEERMFTQRWLEIACLHSLWGQLSLLPQESKDCSLHLYTCSPPQARHGPYTNKLGQQRMCCKFEELQLPA